MQFDVATAVGIGRREHQEDALATDFALGSEFGFAVLSDGMGGHQAGEIASRIVVTEVFSELKLRSSEGPRFLSSIPRILADAANAANGCLRAHTEVEPSTRGMGATLVVPVFVRDHLYWLSVGDSPLFLFRGGELRRLNEDHSLAPQIDYMVKTGLIAADAAMTHPDRNALTSVLIGDEIARVDCPRQPTKLAGGDLVVMASDGIQSLSEERIREILARTNLRDSRKVALALLDEIAEADNPEQDNVSFAVIRVIDPDQKPALERPRSGQRKQDRSAGAITAAPAAADTGRAGPLHFIRGLAARGGTA